LPLARALHVLAQLAHAVDHAHSRGVVHRDLKPENLVLRERRGRPDHVMVLDFGVAKVVAPDYQESFAGTPKGEIFGTVAYMAPEQLTGAAVDPRCDLYAVGCLAFKLLTGEVPFRGRNIEVIHQHVNLPAPLLSGLVEGLPPELDSLVARCLEKQPERRFGSGAELARALERVSHEAAARFDPGETAERDYGRVEADAPTELVPRDELRQARWRTSRALAERLVDAGHHDLQLVLGVAQAYQLDERFAAIEAEAQAVEERVAQVEQSGREREGALRFALGELHYELTHSGSRVDEVVRQIASFEEQLTGLAAQTRTEIDALRERSIALALSRADLDEKRARLYGPLEQVLIEVLAHLPPDQTLAPAIARWRKLRGE
jgi:Protein kinase domain